MMQIRSIALIAVVAGLPLTFVGLYFSFWLAHNFKFISIVLTPGLLADSFVNDTSDFAFWAVFSIIQVIYYLLIASLVQKMFLPSASNNAS
jgi:hypothetical protein